jgi:SAM-dependent methyltransferase
VRARRQTRYARALDLDSWQADERVSARGFAHRWDSVVADGNGEDLFLDLLDRHLGPDLNVLDVGCGHGELTVWVARRVRSVVGLERHAGYLRLGRELLSESGVTNVAFVQAELADPAEAHAGGSLPLRDRWVDLVIDRRGPPLVRYLTDLRRAGRPGAVVVGMHAAGTAPSPPWAPAVPSLRDRFSSLSCAEVAGWVTGPLAAEGISDYRLWWADVPEYLYTPRSLYDRLAGDDALPWAHVAAEIETAFEQHHVNGALILRHIRLVWVVRLP